MAYPLSEAIGHPDCTLCPPQIGLLVIGATPIRGIPSNPFDQSVFISEGPFLNEDVQASISALHGMHMVLLLVENADSEIATVAAKSLRKTLKVAFVARNEPTALLRANVDALFETGHGVSLDRICSVLVYPLTRAGIQNLDFEDARNLLRQKGNMLIGFGSSSVIAAGTAASAVRQALESMDIAQLERATSVFVGISAPWGAVKLQDVTAALAFVRRCLPLVANDAVPYSLTPANEAIISVAVIATGIHQIEET